MDRCGNSMKPHDSTINDFTRQKLSLWHYVFHSALKPRWAIRRFEKHGERPTRSKAPALERTVGGSGLLLFCNWLNASNKDARGRSLGTRENEVPGDANSKASGIRQCPDISGIQVPTNSRIGRHSSGKILTGRSLASRMYSVLSMPRL